MRRKWFRTKRSKWTFGILALLFLISLFIPTPYYLYQPGTVEALSPIITVENGHKTEKGSLHLTTVLSIEAANIYYLAYGYLAPNTEIKKTESVRGTLNDVEYGRMLNHMMDTSQQNAIAAGLRAAGEEVKVKEDGVFVYTVLPTSKAKGKIAVGDIIHAADGKPMVKAADFVDYLSRNKKAGDSVSLTFTHDGESKTATVELVQLDPSSPRPGIGIVPEDEFSIATSRGVKINASDIGGPSAGLMFSLEILNQVQEGDLTKGYQIAGTGTIDVDGHVGQIGGISDKIIAADRAGMDIFFTPADVSPGYANTKEAQAEAAKLGTKMKLVPVATLQEAVDYLKKLPAKNG